jgi:Zn-dependent protease with chaperone function
MLFAVLLGYYALVIRGLSELAMLAGTQLVSTVSSSSLRWMPAIGLTAVAATMAYLVRTLFQAVFGLVTSRYEREGDAATGIALSRTQHPDLYAIVAEVAAHVDAPLPDEIQVVESASCFVSELRTLAIQTERRLILVLGMPHLTVLSVSELQVILAHELAHFRSGDTRVALFFYRFVETLRAMVRRSEQWWWHRADPNYWLAKGYLYLFLYLSAPIGRQKELRADALSAEAYGGELASRTLLKEWLLTRQFDATVRNFVTHFDGHRTADSANANIFRWFAREWYDFSPGAQDYLRRRLAEEERPSVFDSHPTIEERIKAMQGFPSLAPSNNRPAFELFEDATELERQLQLRLLKSLTASPKPNLAGARDPRQARLRDPRPSSARVS